MTRYYDIESNEVITENQLKEEYEQQIASGIIDEMTFSEFIRNSLTRYNGTLEIIQ